MDKLLTDHKEAMRAVLDDPDNLEYVSPDIDGYEEIVFEAINYNPRSVQFASEEIRNNPEIMEAVIEQFGDAIEFLGESLLNDPNSYHLKLMAVRQWGGALGCLPESDKNDEDLVLEALYGSEDDIDPSSVFGYMGNELKANKEFVMEHFLRPPHEEEFFDIGIIRLLPESLQNDSEVMLSAVKVHASCLRVMQEKWRNDKNVVMVAIGQDGDLLEFVSDELKDDIEVVAEAVKTSANAIKFASERVQSLL